MNLKSIWAASAAPLALATSLNGAQAAPATDYNYGVALGVREAVLEIVSLSELASINMNGAMLARIDPYAWQQTPALQKGEMFGKLCAENSFPSTVTMRTPRGFQRVPLAYAGSQARGKAALIAMANCIP
jgi:hypothetical protein